MRWLWLLIVVGCARSIEPTEMCEPVPPMPDTLSVLFVMDNGGLVSPEQLSLASELPWLIETLGTGDIDEDGVVDLPPFEVIRFGVVTTDMGTGGFALPTCAMPGLGDDGLLRTEGNWAREGCVESYPRFAEYRPESDSVAAAEEQMRCVLVTGDDDGCGFEQPLEAALKAVTPSSSDLRFFRDTRGHADGSNLGFFEAPSALAIVVMDDEDDGSVLDPDFFDPDGVYSGSLLLRAFHYPEALHPVDRYVDGLLAALDAPTWLTFAVIAGVPPRLSPARDADGYDAVLEDPDMQPQIDLADPNRLRPSCNTPGIGLAFPPVRLVEVARALDERGAATAVGSSCQNDLRPPLRAMLESMALRAGTTETCVSR